MRSKVQTVPFTNGVGQVLLPGDQVVFITSGWGVHAEVGFYRGRYPNGHISVGFNSQKQTTVFAGTDVPVPRKLVRKLEYKDRARLFDTKFVDAVRTTRLQRARAYKISPNSILKP